MTQPERLLRVALYVQADTITSAGEQAGLLLQRADSAPTWRVVAAFCDITSDTARPARTGAVSATAAGGFDLLLVGSPDRLPRSTDLASQTFAGYLATDGRRDGPHGRPAVHGVRVLIGAQATPPPQPEPQP